MTSYMNKLVSFIIPTHKFKDSEWYLNRCLDSIRSQTYQNFEIIIKDKGTGMSDKLNQGIKEANGDLIKILFTDDYLADENALKRIVDAHKGYWSVCACIHDNGRLHNPHVPKLSRDIVFGNNTIGSPSVLTLKNMKDLPLWDENLQWLVDCVYYTELYNLYGKPEISEDINVVIGLHPEQLTNVLSDDYKLSEHKYVKNKFA